MKKLFSFILLITLLFIGIGFNDNEVKAISMNFDFGNVSPRFQYLKDDSDILIPFEFTIYEKYDHPREVESFEIILKQVLYEGAYVKNLEIFEVFPYIHHKDTDVKEGSTNYVANISSSYSEHLYIGDINTQYETLGKPESWSQLNVFNITVNGNPLLVTDYEFSEDDEYIILDPAVSTVLDVIIIYYMYQFSDDYEADLYYDWSGIDWVWGDVVFYQLVYNDIILFTGGVMKTPIIGLTYDSYAVEFGEFLVQDDGIVDFSDQNDFTTYLNYDKFWILHYRIPEGFAYLSHFYYVFINDISTGTLETSFVMDEVLSLQGGDGSNFVNSFIPVSLNGEIGGGLITDYTIINLPYQNFTFEYVEGSYLISMTDQGDAGALLANSDVVWNVVNQYNPFKMYVMKEEIFVEDLQRVIFEKNSELISSSYTTVLAKDYGINVDYIDLINEYDKTFAISYHILDTLTEDDCVSIGWNLEPIYLPYSLVNADYAIEFSEEYCVLGEMDIGNHIDNTLVYWAMDDEIGGMIFTIFVLLGCNVLLIFVTREAFIFSFVNLTVILVLSFIVYVPMWIIIGVVLLSLLGFKISFMGGSSYE